MADDFQQNQQGATVTGQAGPVPAQALQTPPAPPAASAPTPAAPHAQTAPPLEQPTGKEEVRKCETCGKDFLIIPQEQEFYKKKELPWPKNCPECRQKRRLSLRNERKLYKRKCDKCQKDIISTYSPDSKYIVYCQDCFWKNIG